MRDGASVNVLVTLLTPAVLYALVVASMAFTAVLTRDKERRDSALRVLSMMLRRNPPPVNPPRRQALKARRRRREPDGT
jgi:hypothetical protein